MRTIDLTDDTRNKIERGCSKDNKRMEVRTATNVRMRPLPQRGREKGEKEEGSVG